MTLSENLNLVADKLQSGELTFNWHETESCCCGLVAQAILGKSRSELSEGLQPVCKKLPKDKQATWQNMLNAVCPLTGIPTNEIFAGLMNAGLSRSDIYHLEYLSDPIVLALCPKHGAIRNYSEEEKKRFIFFTKKVREEICRYKDRQNLIVYLRALAELKYEQPEPTPTNRLPAMSLN